MLSATHSFYVCFARRFFILHTNVGDVCAPLSFKWFCVSVQMSLAFDVQQVRNLELMSKMDLSPPEELLIPAGRAPEEVLIFVPLLFHTIPSQSAVHRSVPLRGAHGYVLFKPITSLHEMFIL